MNSALRVILLGRRPSFYDEMQAARMGGWTERRETFVGIERSVLWKHPVGTTWTKGYIIVMHGGGGSHTQYASDLTPLISPQYDLVQEALTRGFGVILADSSRATVDSIGRPVGKVWNAEKTVYPQLDIPFLSWIIATFAPSIRPVGSRPECFVVGHSSGAFMAIRLAANVGYYVRAVASIAGGDPYGTSRSAVPRGPRSDVFGIQVDNDTLNEIGTINGAGAYPGTTTAEAVWETPVVLPRPPYRSFFSVYDGVVDQSHLNRLHALASVNGFFRGAPTYLLSRVGGVRSLLEHLVLPEYITPLLNYFERGLIDFWDFSNKVPPGIGGWTALYQSVGWTWATVASADSGVTGGNVMRITGGASSAWTACANNMYQVNGDVHAVEIFARYKARSPGVPTGLGAVALMVNGASNGYTLDYTTTTTLAIRRRTAGAATTVATGAITAVTTDTWYHVRFRREIDGIFRAKHWLGSVAEPGAWTIETAAAADMTYRSGFACLSGGFVSVPFDIDTCGFALDGTAPTSSLGTQTETQEEGETTAG